MILTSDLEYIRLSIQTVTKNPVRIAFKSGNTLYGIFWGGDVDRWVPSKWAYPSGKYRLDNRPSDLDLDLDWKVIDENSKCKTKG